jgi:hypothetical protein
MNTKTRAGHGSTIPRIALALICFMPPAAARGQTGGSYDLTWNTIDGGGRTSSTGGSYSLGGTIGQPEAGAATGGTYSLAGGFWPVTQVCSCLGDMNGDGRKDGLDVQQFVSCMIPGEGCACADVDTVGGITTMDAAAFVAALLDGAPCP